MTTDRNREWQNVFFEDDSGRYPVLEYVRSLDIKAQTRIRSGMERLRTENVQAKEPLVKHLEGDLWELRERSDTNIYRVVYFFITGRRIVFLHAFQKRTQRTPRRELDVARQRWRRFLDREAGR